MKKLFFALSFLLCFAQSQAQQITGIRQLSSTTAEVLTKDGGRITIDFYADGIFRMFCDPNGGEIRDPEANPPAKILVNNPRGWDVYTDISENSESVSISSSSTTVSFNKATGLFTISKNNKAIVSQTRPTEFTRSKYTMYLSENPDEFYYGGGVQNGRFSHRGEKIEIVNTNSWTDGGVASPAPFYWSTGGYGVMCHTFAPGLYDFGKTKDGEVVLTHDTNYLDMFFMTEGNDGEGDGLALLRQYYKLTGEPILLPKFGFYEGHLNAYNRDYWLENDGSDKRAVLFEDGKYYRESQKDNGGIKESLNGEKDNYQFSARAVVDRYEAHDMPLGWVLPNDGYGAGYGQTETLDGNIANLKSFGDYARSKGVEIGLWTQSNLHPVEGVSALLQRDIVKEVRDAGVRVLKTDVAWVGDGYSFGLNGIADVAQIMPYYGNNARPFIITLDGWAGTQRYGAIWSGDQTGGKWEYIRFHIPTYIGAGLSGLGNITSDMDGIFGGAQKDVFIRDFEWKTFTPMQLNMDGWGSNPKYPQAMGEPAASINRSYLKWKSMLLPYSYTFAADASFGGKPLMRAMFIDFPNEYTRGPKTCYQFMYGPSFLVAPIYQATAEDEKGNDIRNGIYLPEGQWIDYFNGDTYEGGKILNNFDAPIWKLPVFVRPGAIIPMNLPNNNPSQIDESKMLVEIYPSTEETSIFVYQDDGKTDAYKQREYSSFNIFQQLSSKGSLTITIGRAPHNQFQTVGDYTFLVNSTIRPRKVSVGKTKLREVFSEKELMENENTYYYNEVPNLNRFATPGSEFAEVKITKNPQIWVHTTAIDVRGGLSLVIDGVEFNRPAQLVSKHGAINIPTDFSVKDDDNTPYSLTPSWQKVENADYYEILYDGQVYSTIRDTHLTFGDLRPQTTHEFKVRAVNADGHSDWTNLTATTKDNPLELAITGITGTVNGPVDIDHEVSRLFDFQTGGDIWFDDMDKDGNPYVLTMDLHCTTAVDNLQYLPREGGGNGTILECQIEVSSDGKNYTDCGNYSWEPNDSTKIVRFEGNPEIRYIRMTINKSRGNYVAGREIFVFRTADSKVYIPGDINQDSKIDDADLTSYLNYTGLKKGDSDFEGYVSKGDLNGNGLIDAYDISEVATKLEGGIHADGNYVYGNLSASFDKSKYAAGEDIIITVKGDSLDAVNALSMEIPYSEKDMRFEKVEPLAVGNMLNMTNDRLHTDGTKALYPTFVNVGDKETISGTKDLFLLRFKAVRAFTAPKLTPAYLLVDKFLTTKE